MIFIKKKKNHSRCGVGCELCGKLTQSRILQNSDKVRQFVPPCRVG